ncbi:MAG: 4Fe-4S binding protein [Candidatus Cloacimonetes bacterium]|nr:4Fe-4S binding protein [Candidatus Cloacimonadota bacterium]MBS3767271.1 4Fe-4S binding protein [Candidatus Cloacimonadota bacterium]
MKQWERPFGRSKPETVKGEVKIVEDRCKGCGFCVEYCPCDVLELSDKFNKKGYHPPYAEKLEECTACKLCEMICPDFAIFVIEKEEEID